MKGIDTMPERRESLGRKCKGPFNRNLLIPKALANKLKVNVSIGRVETVWVPKPVLLEGGKKACVAKMIDRDMCTLKLFII